MDNKEKERLAFSFSVTKQDLIMFFLFHAFLQFSSTVILCLVDKLTLSRDAGELPNYPLPSPDCSLILVPVERRARRITAPSDSGCHISVTAPVSPFSHLVKGEHYCLQVQSLGQRAVKGTLFPPAADREPLQHTGGTEKETLCVCMRTEGREMAIDPGEGDGNGEGPTIQGAADLRQTLCCYLYCTPWMLPLQSLGPGARRQPTTLNSHNNAWQCSMALCPASPTVPSLCY
ncbi:hypothetical protein Q8A73_014358 [Channa argus]|nr:hypothetical protein Q8A73_014358 [Channa argus]